MANSQIPLMVNQVDPITPLLALQQGRRQQAQDKRQSRMDELTIADLAQQREARGLQMEGQKVQNTAQSMEFQRSAKVMIGRDIIAFDNLVQSGDLQSAAQLGQEIKNTTRQAGFPTETVDQVLSLFNNPDQLKAVSAQMRKAVEPMLPQLMSEIIDPKKVAGGQVITRDAGGTISAAPVPGYQPPAADPLDAYIKSLEVQEQELKVQEAQRKAAAGAQETTQKTEQAAAAQSSLIDQSQMVAGYIKKALDLVDTTQSGYTGAALAAISPSGENAALRRNLDTIKANIGFDKIMEMKRSSPTGGALGAVSERELLYLQATLGSLDARSSDAEIKDVLSKVYDVYQRINTGAGGQGLPPLTTGQPMTGAVDRTGVVDGATATNPQTGERVIYRNGRWEPISG